MTETNAAARHLVVKQRFTPIVNQYEIRESDANATEGNLIGFVQQKRMRMREEVIFYADDSKTRPVFSFKSRKVLDVHGATDIFDASHQPIGHFRKDFTASLLRSTWFVGQVDGPEYRGEERSMPVALLRRFTDIGFIPYHFDFTGPDGVVAFSVVKKWGLRDKYVVTIFTDAIDVRVISAMAVALDALQDR